MIYETIPVHYFDHTALLKAVVEANVLCEYTSCLANQAAEELMDDDVTSGEAVGLGVMVNMLKNIEWVVEHWLEVLAPIASKCKIYGVKSEDYHYEYEEKIDTELANESLMIPKVISDFYDEWEQHLHPLARKYNIPVARNKGVDFKKNGMAERQR